MKKFISTLSLAILLLGNSAFAQTITPLRGMFNFSWDINVPLNNKNFISDVSLPGAKMENRWFINPKTSLGLELEWFSMYEYTPRQTYEFPKLDVTTDLYKYVYTVPITASIHYYPIEGNKFLPFFGVAAGTAYMEPSVYFNIYQLTDDNWGFTAKPEVGCIVPFGADSEYGIYVSARYNYYSNKFSEFRLDQMQTISFNVGISFLR